MGDNHSGFSTYDSYLFHEGTHFEIYRRLGAHLAEPTGIKGVSFAVWAPSAKRVSLLSERTSWSTGVEMVPGEGGIWEAFVPEMEAGESYRYEVQGADGIVRYKADPMAFCSERRPANASVVYPLDGYEWGDQAYMQKRNPDKATAQPMSVYEVYLGSWKMDEESQPDGFLNYREYARQLVEYIEYMGYTHIELMGICEFPYDGSWGYQVTGFFSPTSRYGSPDDFRYFVDLMHQHNIGVILDWVPAHFPKDAFGLEKFDGTPLYEPEDPLRAEYPEWGTNAFDHGKSEVRSFLISSAYYWIHEFHVDAMRVDAVAAMLYTSFGRAHWRPNIYGGNENLESTAFLKQLNQTIRMQTDGYMIAEDSSIMEGVTTPVEYGGLGFMFKWNMGWMNDTLRYVSKDPIFRKWHHENITHSLDYAFLENFMLVLSHDEVVHGKRSMLEKNPGNMMDKLGGLKTMYTYQFTHPGKKLLFMGQEFAMNREWDEKRQIDWYLADDPAHRDVMDCLRKLMKLYRDHPVLYVDSRNPNIFEWVNRGDASRNIISYIRRNPWNYQSALLVVCNFSPVGYDGYTCGLPLPGYYNRLFSTYDSIPGGGGPDEVSIPPITAKLHDCDGYKYMMEYNLRPFEAVIFDFPLPE